MKYKPSALVETMSGSQGDNTFSTGRAGDYIRRRVDPAQPRTAAQTSLRAAFSAGSAAWRSLTEAQRTGWKNIAAGISTVGRYGQTYHPTGQQVFVGRYVNSMYLGDGPPDSDPIPVDTPPHVTNLVLVVKRGAAAANDIWTLTANVMPEAGALVIKATPNISAGRAYFSPGQFKKIAQSNAADGLNADSFRVQWEALFGRPVIGSRVATEVDSTSPQRFSGGKVTASTIVIAV